jgi:hypothetical protein
MPQHLSRIQAKDPLASLSKALKELFLDVFS